MNIEAVEPKLLGNVVTNICQAIKNARSIVMDGLTKRQGKVVYNNNGVRRDLSIRCLANDLN